MFCIFEIICVHVKQRSSIFLVRCSVNVFTYLIGYWLAQLKNDYRMGGRYIRPAGINIVFPLSHPTLLKGVAKCFLYKRGNMVYILFSLNSRTALTRLSCNMKKSGWCSSTGMVNSIT